ncbi:MAG: EAL domain-containing protein [Bradyrhizobiaceae bacterium]|nr:MAG: EAL domain-containing protein [Bradyrhizobiaceae bacterium]
MAFGKTFLSGIGIGGGQRTAHDDSSENIYVVRRGPIRWLVLSGILLIAMIAVGTAIMVGSFRDRAILNANRELENTLLLLARHFDQQFEDGQVIQKDVLAYIKAMGIETRSDFERIMSGRDVHHMLNGKIRALSYIGAVNIFDAEGRLINSSDVWPVPDVNVADRSYFRTFKTDPSREFLLESLVSRISGAWTTVLVRKVTGPDHEFLGVVSRGIEPKQFEKFFGSLSFGDNSAISMFHRDGTMLARYPHVESMIGRNFSNGPMFQNVLSKAKQGTMRIVSPVDGEDRLAAVRQLRNYPIVLIATTTVASVLSDWREQTRFLILAAGLSSWVVATLLFLVVRQLSHQHQKAQRRLALEKQRLDTAVNNMNQGLLLFDASMKLVVCNDRYIEMYGLSRNEIKPGCTFRDIVAHRKLTGSFVGDVDAYCNSIVRDLEPSRVVIAEMPDGRSIQMTFQPVADGGWVSTHEDITERRRSEARIAHMAHFDALTGLPNRALFRERLEAMLKEISPGIQIAVLYIDIDEFKTVNDSLGHPVGDELLKGVAQRLKQCTSEDDLVARLGGDEFAIVRKSAGSVSDVTDLVIRVQEAIRRPYYCLGHHVATDASIGIARAPMDGSTLDGLLKNADLAMYAAKADGRRTYRFFHADMDARAQARRSMETELRQALADGNFEVYYQPIARLSDNGITGCEALLRWRHPERGMISPVEFIPIAEETGLIDQLGAWVLTTACAEAATWPADVKLAVNVSPVQFRNDTFALKVAGALASSGLGAGRLELEITEAVLIRDDEKALAILHQLRALGVRIALDDFGTGYSSLSYLQRFPFDKIKIDRCFVEGIDTPNGSLAIVQAVANIASAQLMDTTAEGVETKAQRDMLLAVGCTEMQGYLFSKPKPAAEIGHFIRSNRADKATVA